MTRALLSVDALVVGAGPAGLAAATALKGDGAERVVIIEREDEAGGIPRHCAHTGFGVRDLHRVLRGPAYARSWVERAAAAGAEIRTRAMVTGWSAQGRAEVTGPGGLLEVGARAIVLATGARERPRAARLVPGTRPAGVFTTGQLQQWVHREHLPVGRRAIVVGAEHVSYSAVLTLRDAGVSTVALITEHPFPQSFRLFDLFTRYGLRTPVWTGTSLLGIYGRDRIDHVLVRGPGGERREVAVDTVVFTGDFIPDHELARRAGLPLDRATRGPACEADGATSVAGLFAAGNLVHPVETADVTARRAGAVGAAVAAWLREGAPPTPRATVAVAVQAVDPLQWVVPNLVTPVSEPAEVVLVRSRHFVERPRVDVTQDGRLLGSYRMRRLVPNRSQRIPSGWQREVRAGADVLVSVVARSGGTAAPG